MSDDQRNANSSFIANYFRDISAWQRHPDTTVGHVPWIRKESFTQTSFVEKYCQNEFNPGYIDLNNPFQVEVASELRPEDQERSRGSKKKQEDFSVIKEGVRKVEEEKGKSGSDSDDFLDEFGNIKEEGVSLEKEKEDKQGKEKSTKETMKTENVTKAPNKPKANRGKGMWVDHDNTQESARPLKSGNALGAMNFKVQEPRSSHLRPHEQIMYLNMLQKFKKIDSVNKLTEKETKEFHVFQGFNEIVKNEQREFQKFAEDLFYSHGRGSKVPELHPAICEYVDKYIEHKLNRVKEYPAKFVSYTQVKDAVLRMVPPDFQNRDPQEFEMRFEKTLVDIGNIPKVSFPRFKRLQENQQIAIGKNFETLNNKRPVDPRKLPMDAQIQLDGNKVSSNQYLYKVPITKDPNVKILAEKYPIDIVIGVGALKTIFETVGPPFTHEWEIPIEVRIFGSKRVVFIDSALPKRRFTVQEKDRIFHQVASKAFMIQPWTQSKQGSRLDRDLQNTDDEEEGGLIIQKYDDPFDSEIVDLSDMETFGTGTKIQQVDGGNEDVENKNSHVRVTRQSARKRIQESQTSKDELSQNLLCLSEEDSCEESGLHIVTSDDEKGINAQNGSLISHLPIEPEPEKTETAEAVEEQYKSDRDSGLLSDSKGVDLELAKSEEVETCSRGPEVLGQIETERGAALVSTKIEKCSGRETISNSRNKSEGFLEGLMAAQSNLLVTNRNKGKDSSQRRSYPFASILRKSYKGEKLSVMDEGLNEADFLQPLPTKNINYRLWSLRPKVNSNSSISVLVRSNIHGIQRMRKDKTLQTYTVSSKVEYQSNLGAEMLSKSEIARDWMATMLRPGSKLARLRVSSEDQRILMCEEKTLQEQTRDGLMLDFKPAIQLGHLYTLFNSLQSIQEPGHYLLQHDGRSAAFVRILKSVGNDVKEAYDLHSSYEVGIMPQIRGRFTWTHLDFSIITPQHLKQNRVPGLFQPARDFKNASAKQQSGNSNKRKKKGGQRGGKKRKAH